MTSSFRILTVCTGNICRSPLAERFLAANLPESAVEIQSAGVQAMRGFPMDERTQNIARGLGIPNPDTHVARQITSEMINDANLILAMDSFHRRYVVEQSPKNSKYVYTVREFARLAGATKLEDLRDELKGFTNGVGSVLVAAVEAARLSRSEVASVFGTREDDVIDPYGKDAQVFDESTRQLIPALESIIQYFELALSAEH